VNTLRTRDTCSALNNRLHHHGRLADSKTTTSKFFRQGNSNPTVLRQSCVKLVGIFLRLVPFRPVFIWKVFADFEDSVTDC
jgi:hypothetical protein